MAFPLYVLHGTPTDNDNIPGGAPVISLTIADPYRMA